MRMQKATENYCINDLRIFQEPSSQMEGAISNDLTDQGIRMPRSGNVSNEADRVVILQNPQQKQDTKFKIGTWNVRSLLKPTTLHELKEIMRNAEIDVLGLSETRWKGVGDKASDNFRIIHSGKEKQGSSGVAIILNEKWKNNVTNTYHVNDRMMMISLKAKPKDLYIIQVYFPTSRSTEEEIEEMYEKLEELISMTGEADNVIIMGDFNASVGCQNNQEVIGMHGLGKENDRGLRLIEFCEQYDLIISNTYFKVPLRRRYTWKAPGDKRRYQIDYILVKRRFRNQVKSSHTYPGYDIDSDHNLLVAKCDIKLRKLHLKTKSRLCIENLKLTQIRKNYEEATNRISESTNDWNNIKEIIEQASLQTIGKTQTKKRKPWMTEEIMKLIQERNVYRKNDYEMYKKTKNTITERCKREKEKWLEEFCSEIDKDMARNNIDKVYGKVKSLQGKQSTKSNIVKSKNGEILFKPEKVSERWKEYIEELYEGEEIMNEEKYIENECEVDEDMIGPPIDRSEFDNALKALSDKKATGIDEIPGELLKNAGEEMKNCLFELIKEIYEEGEIPEDFIKSKTITIPKKGNATECSNYRTIALLSHASKILLNVVKNRMKTKVEERLEEDQFGFRKGKGTREGILALRMILERRLEVNKKTVATFIDLEKAFDKVDWELLFKALKKANIDWKDRRFIMKLYKDQSTEINVNEDSKKEAKVRNGIRQGCPLSPYLFNVFIEEAMNEVKEKTEGVKVNGVKVHCIRFADDVVLLAEDEESMNQMLEVTYEELSKSKLKINAKKTKYMTIEKAEEDSNTHIKIRGVEIEKVDSFCYLGSEITKENRSLKDVKKRIALAKCAFRKKQNLITNKKLNLETRKKFVKTYVWSVLNYGCETWALDKIEKKKLEAMEMWIWRRVNNTKWTDMKTNQQVLIEINEKRNLLKLIVTRKVKLTGHLIRHNEFLKNIMEGKVEDKKGRGRPKDPSAEECVREDELQKLRGDEADSSRQGGMATSTRRCL
uniref:Craniofacial development protein 2 n=1 Tax=Cacopsylla melanoneura TaxID=428564 RepID=A0A8D8Y198_9HEMI